MEYGHATSRTGLAGGLVLAVGILIAIAAIFGLGPCAEDDLSVTEYLARGDEICTRAHDEFLDLQSATPRTPAEAAELVRALIDVAEEERDAIADLPAPISVSGRVDSYLAARDAGITQLNDGLKAAEAEDASAYRDTQAGLESSQARRQALAHEVGFNECSKPLSG